MTVEEVSPQSSRTEETSDRLRETDSESQGSEGAQEGVRAPIRCHRHPNVDAIAECDECGAPVCATCEFSEFGCTFCPDCAARPAGERRTGSQREKVYGNCEKHPNNPAIAKCRKCRALICSTCEFRFPGNLVYCPACATAAPTGLSSKRKTVMVWSYVLAVWATLGILVFLVVTAQLPQQEDPGETVAIEVAFNFLVLSPAIIGAALGVSAFDKNLHNPPTLWIAPIWNGLILLAIILLMVVGFMAGGV
jgi:hypothetical protein